MKKSIWLILTIFLIVSGRADAQIVKGFGLKVGGAIANQDWDYAPPFDLDSESRLGLDIAVFTEFLNAPFISILAEVHYLQKGFTISQEITTIESPNGTGEFWTQTPRVDYVSFPILAKISLPAPFSPYVIGGPRLDIRIGQKGDGFDAVYDDLETFDLGATLGLGVESPRLASFNLLAEIRYSPSLTDVFENDALKVKNESIEFLTGVRF